MNPRPYRFVQCMLDRHGVMRYYFRRLGFARVALPGPYGSPEFAHAYQIAFAGGTPMAPIAGVVERSGDGTMAQLIDSYLLSAAWLNPARDPKGLSEGTRNRRAPMIRKFRAEHAHKLVIDCRRRHVEAMIEGLTPCVQQDTMKIIRAVMGHAVRLGLIEADPSQPVKASRPDTDGFHTWTDPEIAQYRARHPNGTRARLAMEFALEAASRRCEVIHLGRQHLVAGDEGERRIIIHRAKGSNDVNIKLSPELAAAIDALPANGQLLFLTNEKGVAYSADLLGRHFAVWCTEAGLQDRCRMHGLKKSFVRQCFENGVPSAAGMAATGHKSSAVYDRYGRKYNRAKTSDGAVDRRANRKRAA